MHYIIYKVTNLIDGKFYIGSHKTKDLNDKYMGSGKYLKHAQEKYGIENFKKEVLFVFDTAEEMYAKEAEIVNEDFLATQNTYNLKIGGFGGWDYINANPTRDKREFTELGFNSLVEYGLKIKEQGKGFFALDKQTRIENSKKGAETTLKRFPNGNFYGRKHSIESKKKIAERNSKSQSGSNNSQYGTRWIHSLELKASKRIKKEEPLPDGWSEGRKIKFK